MCTDVKLAKTADKKGMRLAINTMMFRRVLVSLDASDYVSQQSLIDLGLSKEVVGSIEQKLCQDGVIKEEGSVNGSALEEAKRKYFGKRASKRSRDEEEIENMSQAADELHIGDQVAVEFPKSEVRGRAENRSSTVARPSTGGASSGKFAPPRSPESLKACRGPPDSFTLSPAVPLRALLLQIPP